MRLFFPFLLAIGVTAAVPAAGQEPVRPVGVADGVSSRPSPLGYFFRSLVIPGWGQAALDRKLTGGLFLAFEGVALGMTLKAHHEMRYLERTGSGRLDSKRDERADWIFLIGVNHLFAGMEAYVSANLFDFPGSLRARSLPNGARGFGLTIPMPR